MPAAIRIVCAFDMAAYFVGFITRYDSLEGAYLKTLAARNTIVRVDTRAGIINTFLGLFTNLLI